MLIFVNWTLWNKFHWFEIWLSSLTHWGQVKHICVSELIIIGSDNGLSPVRHQAIIWTNEGILLVKALGTKFSEILKRNSYIFIQENAYKMLSVQWRYFCPGLNVLKKIQLMLSAKWQPFCLCPSGLASWCSWPALLVPRCGFATVIFNSHVSWFML